MNTIIYHSQGVCSKTITIDLEGGKVKEILFEGGCNGNTQGVAKLAAGMKVSEVIKRLKGIDCGGKGTSCPDQLARALAGHAKT